MHEKETEVALAGQHLKETRLQAGGSRGATSHKASAAQRLC